MEGRGEGTGFVISLFVMNILTGFSSIIPGSSSLQLCMLVLAHGKTRLLKLNP